MAYQTGVSSSKEDLLNAVFTFAQDHGFTVGPSQTLTSSALEGSVNIQVTYNITSLVKGGVYFLFAIPNPEVTTNLYSSGFIYMNTATGWDGSNFTGIDAYWTRGDRFEGPHVGYHLFCDGLTVAVAVEVVTNVFCHFMFGSITKNGSWAGGEFVAAMSWSRYSSHANYIGLNTTVAYISTHFGFLQTSYTASRGTSGSNGLRSFAGGHVRTPMFGPVAQFNANRSAAHSMLFEGGTVGSASVPYSFRMLVRSSPNSFNGRSVLLPVQFFQSSGMATSAVPASPHLQLGYLGNVAHVNVRDLQPKEVVNGDWMVFPVCEKNGSGAPYPNTFDYGYAFKK